MKSYPIIQFTLENKHYSNTIKFIDPWMYFTKIGLGYNKFNRIFPINLCYMINLFENFVTIDRYNTGGCPLCFAKNQIKLLANIVQYCKRNPILRKEINKPFCQSFMHLFLLDRKNM